MVPGQLRPGRVEHHDRDPGAHQRHRGGGVEHLGAEGGQLGRLLVARGGQRRGPTARSADRRSSARPRRSRSPPASAPSAAPRRAAVKSEPPRPSVVGTPSAVAPMKPWVTGIEPVVEQRPEAFARPVVDHLDVGRRPAEAVVGHHDRPDVGPRRREPGAAHRRRPPAASSTARRVRPARRAPPAGAAGPARPRATSRSAVGFGPHRLERGLGARAARRATRLVPPHQRVDARRRAPPRRPRGPRPRARAGRR